MVALWVVPFALTTGVTTLGAVTVPFFVGFKIPEIFDGAPGIKGTRFLISVGILTIGVTTGTTGEAAGLDAAGFETGFETGSAIGLLADGASATGFTTTISGSSEIKTVTVPSDVAVPISVTTPPTMA